MPGAPDTGSKMAMATPSARYTYREDDATADAEVTVTFGGDVNVLLVRAIDNDIRVCGLASQTTQDGSALGQPTTIFGGEWATIPYWYQDTSVITARDVVYVINADSGETFSFLIEGHIE